MIIKQHTQAWLDAKQSCVGASEIYSLVHHYFKHELINLGIDVENDKPFRTIQEVYLKVKFNITPEPIDPIYSEFGLAMEDYLIHRVNKTNDFVARKSDDFYQNDIMAVSPDGLLTANGRLYDFDGLNVISHELGEGALELKTCYHYDIFKIKNGSKFQYITQLVYQMMVMDKQWGCLFMMVPNHEDMDLPFYKGKMVAWKDDFSKLEQQDYSYFSFIYTRLPVLEDLILRAIHRFQDDLFNFNVPRESDSLPGLMREKKMWMKINPEKYGALFLTERSRDIELKELINKRIVLNIDASEASKNLKLVENKILETIKKNDLDHHSEIIGDTHRILFTSNDQMRFYKVK